MNAFTSHLFVTFILFLIRILDAVGFIVVLKGACMSLYDFLRCSLLTSYIHNHKKKKDCVTLDGMRLELGRHIILGLEFFVAADIVKTIFTPTWNDIGKLAAIILIRTVLSVFLTKELRSISKNA